MSDEKNKEKEGDKAAGTAKAGESLGADKARETAKDKTAKEGAVEEGVLVGSPNFDAEIKLGNNKKISLGDLVQAAFDSTTVDEEYWNEMSQERRDKVIQRTLDGLKS